MLGDAGANALGAMLGAAAARTLPRTARAGLLAGIVALTVASEKVSFTRVIAARRRCDWLDMLGRRPAPPAAQSPVRRASADMVPGPRRWRLPAGRHRRGATAPLWRLAPRLGQGRAFRLAARRARQEP